MSKEQYLTLNRASGPNSDAPTTPFVKVVALIATLGGLQFGYDTGVISGALLFMGNELHLTPFTTGLVTSSLLFGAAFGALLSGYMASAAGRKKIILWLAVIFAIGAIGTALAPDVNWMIFFRLVLGVAVGGAAATVPVYIAEMAPANKRGQLVTLQELMIVSGQLLAYISNAGFHAVWGGESTWRWMLAVATLPAVLLWFGMMFMPDSPRWYAMKGRLAEARRVLERTRRKEDVEWELMEISETLDEQRSLGKPRFREIMTPWLFKLFMIGIGIAVIQQLTGVNTIMYYAPTVLTSVGMSDNAALFATIANGVVSVLMTFVGIWMLGKIGRRTMTMIGQFGCTACLVFIGAVSYLLPETVNGQPDALQTFDPGGSYLLLFNMCDDTAIFSKGPLMFRNSLAFMLKDYIDRAGGYTQVADNARVVIAHRDGAFEQVPVDRLLASSTVKPGDQILVLPKVDEKKRQFWKDMTQIIYQIAVSAKVVFGL